MNDPTFDDLPDPSKTSLEDFLKATAKRARAIWKKHNPDSSARLGRPSERLKIFNACERLAKQKRNDFSRMSLNQIAQIISRDFPETEKNICETIKTHAKKWLVDGWSTKRFDLDQLPLGLAPYLIKSQKDFADIRWLLCWGAICEEQPEVMEWVKRKKCELGAMPPELPHEVLPKEFTKRYQNWESQYYQWIMGGLLRAQKNRTLNKES